MFEKIKGLVMNILNFFHAVSVEEITGVDTAVTNEMLKKIELWNNMMKGNAPWNEKAKPCGIMDQIAGRLNMLVSREIGLEVENPAIETAMKHLNDNVDKVVEYIALIGGCVVRPIFSNNKLQYEIIPLGNYLPTRYDFDGTLTGAIILKQIDYKNKCFILVENHTYENQSHTVNCKLYRNDNGKLKRASLLDCPQTETITEEYTWQNVKQPMIIEFRNHALNRIDGSNVPVSLLAGIENLVQDADEQYERMNWEQKAGEMKVFADSDLFTKRKLDDGKVVNTLPRDKNLQRLVTMIDGDGSANGSKITEHAPQLRTTAQNEMLQQIFRRIELASCIGKGSISDMESVQQTASQYNGGRQELFAIVDKIEDEIKVKYQICADVFAHIVAAYRIGPNNSRITITWNDDTTRKDVLQAKQMELQEISAGVRAPWEYRVDFMGEDELKAKENVPPAPLAPDPFNFS